MIMGESIGCNPYDGLTQHPSLIVNTFNGQEDLVQGTGSNDVVQELRSERAA
ncbi:rCG49079 [Rattus norvegicus]|uniref:RCG49079 n=1 Tax=Rattus norvegicus TaxID=10116 RepID=A6IGF7_RAT|nr:rCG49079 [Rattus norvegicus]